MRLHKDIFVTKWVLSITSRMAGMCEESFAIPIIALFYNDVTSMDILKRKREMRIQIELFNQQLIYLRQRRWYEISSRISGYIKLWWNKLKFHFSIWRQQLPAEAVNQCLQCPEFEFLQYLHKLTERMSSWSSFREKHLPPDRLSAEFRAVKGHSDPPHAEYSYLVQVQSLADAYISRELQQTMFTVMLAEHLARSQSLTPSHRG